MKKILMISSLNIWSMGEKKGAPSLYNTINALKNSFSIEFLAWGQANAGCYMENVSFNYHEKRIFESLQNVRKVGGLVRIADYIYLNTIYYLKGREIIKKTNVDLIYSYEIGGTLAAKLLSLIYNIPLVTRFQGTILNKHLTKRKLWTSYFPHAYALSTKSDCVIMTNDGTQGDQILEMLNNRSPKICFWMNGVSKITNQSKPEKISEIIQKLGIENKQVIMTVSRLVNWKRLDRIISVMPEIVNIIPHAVLIIVGDGAERKRLEQFVVNSKLENSVFFLGSLKHEQVLEILEIADVFVSLYDLSNVGNPLLEAMIAGKAIVTLNNGDTGKFIQNEENGILIEPEAMSQVSNKIIYLLENKLKAQTLGKNAKKFAQNHFWTWEERMRAEVSMLKEIIGE